MPGRILLTFALVLAACAPAETTTRDPFAGVYKIGGGDASIEIVKAITEAYSAKHPGVKFDIDSTLGSDPGVKLTADGTLDLGMVSRELKPDERGLVGTTLIGVAGTGIAVNAQNALRGLTSAQIADLYSGRTGDWSAVGGERTAIIPLIREPGSSARSTFENAIFGGKPTYATTVLEISGGDQMRQAIAAYRGAIGIIGVTKDDPEAQGVRLLSVDGVAPARAALIDGSYKLRRPLYVVSRLAVVPKPAIASLLDFIKSPEGQRILEKF